MIAIAMELLGKGWSLAKAIPWQIWAVIVALVASWALWSAHVGAVDAARRAGFAEAMAQAKDAQARADTAQQAKNDLSAAKSALIDKDKVDALHASNADIDHRAELIRLRHEQTHGATGPGAVPQAGNAAGGTAPAPACDGLSFFAALGVLTEAAKIQNQLNQVLDWEDAQDALANEIAEPPKR